MSSTFPGGIGAKAPSTYTGGLPLTRKLAEERQSGRRASPDSEALVSSDDEHARASVWERVKAQNSVAGPRRRSWLNEIKPPPQRKFSLGAASVNSTGSQPQTPSGEPDWVMLQRANVPPNLTWGTDIWGMDKRRDSLSHHEALASPTTVTHGGEDEQTSLPVQIPLNPTLKTYRSQSYSVGQQDPELIQPPPASSAGRVRSIAVPSHYVSQRTSRPSLGSVMEDEVPDLSSVDEGGPQSGNLRKQATIESASRFRLPFGTQYPQSADLAIEDVDDLPPEVSGRPSSRDQASSSKRAHWASSLDFGQLPAGSQSRRHSTHVPALPRGATAEPTPLMSSGEPSQEVREQLTQRLHSLTLNPLPESKSNVLSVIKRPTPVDPIEWLPDPNMPVSPQMHWHIYTNRFAARYFTPGYDPSAPEDFSRALQVRPPTHGAPAPAPAAMQHGLLHQPLPRRFFIISFKCGRSEIYYIPTHMGLNVSPGEMVIVEGDRGHDLGSVVHCDVTERDAKKLKRDADHEHFKWLMMYSRYKTSGADGMGVVSANPMADNRGHDREGEFKPKMIKRLAHQHEINGLKEKEGLEARAKRTCASKVVDHGLQMEILDAEYQLDFKKLTFYFFAETYVNFNDLVQDLFKQFKTRIWLAAINPAAFPAAPSIPSAVAPGVTHAGQGGGQQPGTGSHGAAVVARRAAGLSGVPEVPYNRQWAPAPAGENRAPAQMSPGASIVPADSIHSYFERGPSRYDVAPYTQPEGQAREAEGFPTFYPQTGPQVGQVQQSYSDWRSHYDGRYQQGVQPPMMGLAHPQMQGAQVASEQQYGSAQPYASEPFHHQLRSGGQPQQGRNGGQQRFSGYASEFHPMG